MGTTARRHPAPAGVMPGERQAFQRGGRTRSRQRNGSTARSERNARDGEASGEGLARILGLFSVGLGLSQLLAPEAVARVVGVRDDDRTRSAMRALGMRELASGVGILGQPDSATWVWSRVAGDVMDLALLGRIMTDESVDRDRTAMATAAVLGVTALDVIAARRLSRDGAGRAGTGDGRLDTERVESVTILRPREEVYAFWRDFQNLPRFMRHLESVRVLDGGRSHWVARAPAGRTVEWDAVIVEDRPNELIAWRSVEGADVDNAGSVRFGDAPGGRGTEVRVELRYDPPAGRLGTMAAMLFHEEPGQQVNEDLRRFKQVMETGGVVVSDATVERGPHPAQPVSHGVRGER